MDIGVVGLGLIGGSMAKTIRRNTPHTVLGTDTEPPGDVQGPAAGAIDGDLTDDRLGICDIVFIATWPRAAVTYVQEHAAAFKKGAWVIDLCGVKRAVCGPLFETARENGFTFIGGHPMAGTHNSGFKYARADMFRGAPMVIVPPVYDDIVLLDRVKHLLAPAGFASLSVTTGAAHDRMIAFTSQLAHIVSSAYVKSPLAARHKGFSAGSFLDMTRVARLNEDMWTELFFDNADMLSQELGGIIERLEGYKLALDTRATVTMKQLLREGREAKEALDE